MTMSGRNDSASPPSSPAIAHDHIAPVKRARIANTADHRARATAPCQASAASPIGVIVSSAATDARADRCSSAPRTGQRVQREDDAEVLQQAEGPLGLQRVSEDPVPAGEHVQRPRSVQVQEIDVRHLALLHEAREHEHEPFLHRRTGRAQQAANRQQCRRRAARQPPVRRGGSTGVGHPTRTASANRGFGVLGQVGQAHAWYPPAGSSDGVSSVPMSADPLDVLDRSRRRGPDRPRRPAHPRARLARPRRS